MSASQDFRDGAATGAAIVALRARTMIGWGVTVDDRMLDKLAEGVVYEYGGKVYVDSAPSDPYAGMPGAECAPARAAREQVANDHGPLGSAESHDSEDASHG